MGSASISGLASGLDTATIISQLMQLEAIPQSRLKTQITSHQSVVTKLQELNTKIAALATKAADLGKSAGWMPVTATSSYDKVTIAATSGAQPGALTFTVQSTAKAHSVSSTNTAAALSSVVLTGGNKDLRLTIGGTQHTINAGGGTLQEIVDAVNNANLGVRARAFQTSTGGYALQVDAANTGAASSFTLTRGNNTALMGGMTASTTGSDASIKIGNHTISSATNTFTNVLPGVSVTLGPDAVANTVVTANMAIDSKTMTETVKGLVDALNSVLADIDSATQTATGDNKTAGVLAGDSRLRSLRDQLVNTLYSATGAGLSTVGVQLDRNGKFTFDETKFKSAYQADPTGTAAKFTTATSTGFMDRLATVTKAASKASDGTLSQAITGRKKIIDDLEDSVAAWDQRLELRRTTLTRQYTALETALGQMNSQSNWLAGQISSLPTYSS